MLCHDLLGVLRMATSVFACQAPTISANSSVDAFQNWLLRRIQRTCRGSCQHAHDLLQLHANLNVDRISHHFKALRSCNGMDATFTAPRITCGTCLVLCRQSACNTCCQCLASASQARTNSVNSSQFGHSKIRESAASTHPAHMQRQRHTCPWCVAGAALH